MAVVRKRDHILLGDVGETFSGALLSQGSEGHLELPWPVGITVGSDGILLEARDAHFAPPKTLEDWPGVEPYVSGEVYFLPWEGIRGIDVELDDAENELLAIRQVDDHSIRIHLQILGAASRFLDQCRGLTADPSGLASNAALREEILAIVTEIPLLSEEEILSVVNDQGWPTCTRSSLDEILWDPEFPTAFYANLWFIAEDQEQDSQPTEPLAAAILEHLETTPATAETLLESLESEEFDIADVFEVLYDPSMPTYKRRRSWYIMDDM